MLCKQLKKVIFSSLILISACGGGGGSESKSSEVSNLAPAIAPMSEQTVEERSPFTFSARASDSDGSISSYEWKQLSGFVYVTLLETSSAQFTLKHVKANS